MIGKLLLTAAVAFAAVGYSQNNYLDFDGVNDYVEVPNTANTLAGATAISMACKVYPKSNTGGFPNFNGIMGYRNETNFDFYIIQLAGNQIEVRFRNASGTAYSITYNGMTLNQWNHLFLVFNGSTLKLYNGATEVGSTAASGTVSAVNTATLKIGLVQFQTWNWSHKGYIDEASLWNKALSPAEISAIVANSGEIANPAGEANLKLYYKFNQGNAYANNAGLVSLTDEKATQNGTLVNFALSGNSSNWGGTVLTNAGFAHNTYSIYPNPVASELYFSGNNAEISNIKIADISGRIVSETKFNASASYSMDVSQLQSGVYFAVVNGSEKIKFIKK